MSETEFTGKVKPESNIFHISVRAWIVLILVGTCSFLVIVEKPIDPNYMALVGTVVAFYFGQRDKPKQASDGQINEKSTVINNNPPATIS